MISIESWPTPGLLYNKPSPGDHGTEETDIISSPSLPPLRLVSALSFHCHSLLVVGRLSAVVVVAAAVATCVVVFSRAGRLCMPLKCGSLDAPNNPKPQQIILEYVGNYLCRSLGLAGVKRIIWWRAELFDVNQDNSTGQIIRTTHGGQTSGWLGRYVDSFIGEWGRDRDREGGREKKEIKGEEKKIGKFRLVDLISLKRITDSLKRSGSLSLGWIRSRMKQWLKRSAIEAVKRRRFICNNFREIERKLLVKCCFHLMLGKKKRLIEEIYIFIEVIDCRIDCFYRVDNSLFLTNFYSKCQ